MSEPSTSEPDDFVSRAEKSKAFRSLMFGGKVGGAFSGISLGAVAVGSLITFGAPYLAYLVPTLFALIVVAGFVVHFWSSPILSAPFIMFGFFTVAIFCFGFAIYLFAYAALGDALVHGGVLDVALREHARHFKKLTDEDEIKAHIEKNKAAELERNEHRRDVGNVYVVVSALLILTGVYGFFSRLWLIENSIIDTQLRLISLCDRSLRVAENARKTIQVIRFSLNHADSEGDPLKEGEPLREVGLAADSCERELDEMKKLLSDFPYVGFRKGRLLFFKRT